MLNIDKGDDGPLVESQVCSEWTEITEYFDRFPIQEVRASDGDIKRSRWVFRGLSDSRFKLQPTIERSAHKEGLPWDALERLAALEFRSYARMYMNPAEPPDPTDEFTWLAHMQHYSAPTRLLDFTYSPYVALYFATKSPSCDKERSHVRIWAIDAEAVTQRFQQTASRAARKEDQRNGLGSNWLASNNPDDMATERDNLLSEFEGTQRLVAASLLATGTRRAELDVEGCVAVASPPSFNPRLASQQGVFLLNCASNISFRQSLTKMMKDAKPGWCQRLDIPIGSTTEMENKLFQMNIHEQSLFPDLQGLAGFIHQKIRLHWK